MKKEGEQGRAPAGDSTSNGVARRYLKCGRALGQLRKERGLTQKEIANLGKWTESFVRKLERGERRPSREKLIAMLVGPLHVQHVNQINKVLRLAKWGPLSMKEMFDLRETLIPSHFESKAMSSESQPTIDCYVHPNGRFTREGLLWNEYGNDKPGGAIYTFKELRRDDEHIYLFDEVRRRDPGRPMYLRIPIGGGTAQWSFPNPITWKDLLILTPCPADLHAEHSS
jgi:transcriptional regulator with XRE-family HTH domain